MQKMQAQSTVWEDSTCHRTTKLMLLLLLLSHSSRVRLCDPIDSSPPGSPIPGILQARTLEWVAISFSNAWNWKVKSEKWSCSVVSDSQWLRDCSPPGSSVHGIFQARVLKWVATAFWTKPMSHNYWSPWALEPMLCNKRSHWNEDRE